MINENKLSKEEYTIEINWIHESIRIENTEKNTYGTVRFSEIEIPEDDREASLEEAIMNMLDNDLINMRDIETGDEE